MDAKRLLRSRLLAVRAARSEAEIAAAAVALADHAAGWSGLSRVAAYAGMGAEPPTRNLLDRLVDADVAIVLPVVTGMTLRWAAYRGWGQLVVGELGLLQPAETPLDGDVLGSADLVLVPALAVDHLGHRLGRGKGFYDRALADVEPDRAVAVVYDDEVLDEIPTEQHDRRVGAVLTPSGLRRLRG
jgi:5-formyltetrahydrofolate cyclo-ligase